MVSVPPWFSAALLLSCAILLASCGQAGSQIGTKLLEGVVNAAASGAGHSGGSTPTAQCPPSCEKGSVCDKGEGRCVTEAMARALARARRESAERPAFDVPPDPCDGRCPPDQRCEIRSGVPMCAPEPPLDP